MPHDFFFGKYSLPAHSHLWEKKRGRGPDPVLRVPNLDLLIKKKKKKTVNLRSASQSCPQSSREENHSKAPVFKRGSYAKWPGNQCPSLTVHRPVAKAIQCQSFARLMNTVTPHEGRLEFSEDVHLLP